MCEVREVLPNRIYKSEKETKDGQEFHINNDGIFSHVFQNVLIRKTRNSNKMPEFDRIQFEPVDDGLLFIMLQYKQKANQLIVKLVDTSSGKDSTPESLNTLQTEASNNMIEESFIFKVQKGKSYFIMVFYRGEINFDHTGT